ncbi:hypothetical protein J2Z21_005790 [Streptomyces griseochromogenes]|uniref:SAM-dependent methyltransferase n=1 Tax=Streptomyces griseochromogenes TaxID=68214 RepID=A0ABS4M082_9ACTN|nr:hypothetical protein [Streptomyces griseochromogenes]
MEEYEAEYGPFSAAEVAGADAWAGDLFGPAGGERRGA